MYIKCSLERFVIFQGVRTSIAKKHFFCHFPGGGSGPLPLWIRTCLRRCLFMFVSVRVSFLCSSGSASRCLRSVILHQPNYAEWNFPSLSIGPVHFQFKGCRIVVFLFYSNFNRTFCTQTVETQIRRRVLRRLIWVCAFCIFPTKRTLGFWGKLFLAYIV